MNAITLYIPGLPASVNAQQRISRHGGIYKTSKAKGFATTVRVLAMKAMQDAGHEMFSGPCSVAIDYYFPDRRRRDAGNFDKVLLDALNGVVYKDDCQIGDNQECPEAEYISGHGWCLVKRKFIDKERSRIEIKIIWSDE